MFKFLKSFFEEWEVIETYKLDVTTSNIFSGDNKEKAQVVFYSKPSGRRKVEIYGVDSNIRNQLRTRIELAIKNWIEYGTKPVIGDLL